MLQRSVTLRRRLLCTRPKESISGEDDVWVMVKMIAGNASFSESCNAGLTGEFSIGEERALVFGVEGWRSRGSVSVTRGSG